jgi:hypothetical protein
MRSGTRANIAVKIFGAACMSVILVMAKMKCKRTPGDLRF